MSQSNQRKQLDDEEQLTMIQLKVHSLHIIVLSTTILIISNKMQIAGVVECKKGNKHSNMPIQMICLNT